MLIIMKNEFENIWYQPGDSLGKMYTVPLLLSVNTRKGLLQNCYFYSQMPQSRVCTTAFNILVRYLSR